MVYHQHGSRTRIGGPVQNGHTRHGMDTHVATYDTTSLSANREEIAHSAESLSGTEQGANGSQYTYPRQLANSDVYSDDYGYDGRHPETIQEHLHYSEVPRAWRSSNREALQALPLHWGNTPPATQERAYDYTEHTYPDHVTARQQRPVSIDDSHRRNRSFDWQLGNRRPLGMSNLRELNQNRAPIHAMDRRLCESQRAGPYDSIRYVGCRSDYEPFYDQG